MIVGLIEQLCQFVPNGCALSHNKWIDASQEARRIYTDGRAWPDYPPPTYAGYSLGKWVDTDRDSRFDTLEVETRYLKGPRLFDQTGTPMADDDKTVIRERIFLDKADTLRPICGGSRANGGSRCDYYGNGGSSLLLGSSALVLVSSLAA